MTPERNDTAPNLIFTGFMGTGKTALGHIVAQAWQRPFLDTDKIIQNKTKRTISDIFEKDGEATFRELEKQCVAEWLPECGAIISTGGGIVTIPGIAEQLRERGIVIALFASAETILERTCGNKNRPLLQTENPLEKIRELLAKRERAYMKSGVNLLTEGRSMQELLQITTRIYNSEVAARKKENSL